MVVDEYIFYFNVLIAAGFGRYQLGGIALGLVWLCPLKAAECSERGNQSSAPGQEITRFPSKTPRSQGAACQKVVESQLMLSGFTQQFDWELVILWSF